MLYICRIVSQVVNRCPDRNRLLLAGDIYKVKLCCCRFLLQNIVKQQKNDVQSFFPGIWPRQTPVRRNHIQNSTNMQLRGILPSTDTFRNENVGEEECREEDNNHVRIAKELVDMHSRGVSRVLPFMKLWWNKSKELSFFFLSISIKWLKD